MSKENLITVEKVVYTWTAQGKCFLFPENGEKGEAEDFSYFTKALIDRMMSKDQKHFPFLRKKDTKEKNKNEKLKSSEEWTCNTRWMTFLFFCSCSLSCCGAILESRSYTQWELSELGFVTASQSRKTRK